MDSCSEDSYSLLSQSLKKRKDIKFDNELIVHINLFLGVFYRIVKEISLSNTKAMLIYTIFYTLFYIFSVISLSIIAPSKISAKKVIVLLIISIFSTLLSKTPNFFITASCASLITFKDLRKEIGFISKIMIISLLLIMGWFFVTFKGSFDFAQRYSLGFSHYNAVSMFTFTAVLGFLFSKEKIKKTDKLFLIFICLVVFYFTKTKTFILIFIAIFWFEKLSSVFKSIIARHFCLLLPLLFTALSIVLGLVFSNSSINIFLSKRPFFWNYYLKDFSFPIFSNVSIEEGYPIDNFYLMILITDGLLALFAYFFVFMFPLKRIIYFKGSLFNSVFFVSLLLFIYNFMESSFMIGLNPLFCILVVICFSNLRMTYKNGNEKFIVLT